MSITSLLQPVTIMVLVSFIFMLFKYRCHKKIHTILLLILAISAFNEIISLLLLSYGFNIRQSTNIYVILNTILWLSLLYTNSNHKRVIATGMFAFAAIAAYNWQWDFEKASFGFQTFIAGGLLYVTLFLWDSILELKKENLTYFSGNQYVIAASPLLFFIGFSILFGFNNAALHHTEIAQGITLYKVVSCMINFVYYALIIFYIYNEKNVSYAK